MQAPLALPVLNVVHSKDFLPLTTFCLINVYSIILRATMILMIQVTNKLLSLYSALLTKSTVHQTLVWMLPHMPQIKSIQKQICHFQRSKNVDFFLRGSSCLVF